MDWVKSFYTKQNEWCGVYSGEPSDDDQQQMRDLARVIGPGPKHLLELGAGGGQRAAAAAMQGHTVVAVELLAPLAANAQRLAARMDAGALTVIQADFYTVALDRTFDAVCYWDGFGVGSDADQHRLLCRIAEWLKPGGRAVIDISTPWFWQYAHGQQMQRGAALRKYTYDVHESRLIDTWWPVDQPEQAVAQSLRCYAPADLRLLLQDTGLQLVAVEPGGAVVYEEQRFVPQAPLEQAMVYRAVLMHTQP